MLAYLLQFASYRYNLIWNPRSVAKDEKYQKETT